MGTTVFISNNFALLNDDNLNFSSLRLSEIKSVIFSTYLF